MNCLAVRTPAPDVKPGFESPVTTLPNEVCALLHIVTAPPPSSPEPRFASFVPAAPSPDTPPPSGRPPSGISGTGVPWAFFSRLFVPISSGSAQTLSGNTHFCVLVGQSMSVWHSLRHLRSSAQVSGVRHCERYSQWLSAASWQTETPSGPFTHSSPEAQSRAAAQATWHLPKVHDSGLLHCEFITQAWPGVGLALLEQVASRVPARSKARAATDFIGGASSVKQTPGYN